MDAQKVMDTYWRTKEFRITIAFRLDREMHRSGRFSFRNCIEMENLIFQMSRTKEKYFYIVALLIERLKTMPPRKIRGPKAAPGVQYPPH